MPIRSHWLMVLLSKSALFLLYLLELSVRERSIWSMNYNSGFIPSWSSVSFSSWFLILSCVLYTVCVVSFWRVNSFSICTVTLFLKSLYLKWIDLFLSVVWLVLAWLSSLSPRGRACKVAEVATYKLGERFRKNSTLLISWS